MKEGKTLNTAETEELIDDYKYFNEYSSNPISECRDFRDYEFESLFDNPENL